MISMFDLGWINQTLALRNRVEAAAQQHHAMNVTTRQVAMLPADLDQNFKTAMGWYRNAADRGFAPAMNNLGQMYLQGMGTNQNFKEALRWHVMAAQANNPVAAWNASVAYVTGQGVERGNTEQKNWSSWNAAKFNKADLQSPILERTIFFGSYLDSEQLNLIREVARGGSSITISISPLQADKRLPEFSSIPNRFAAPDPTPSTSRLPRYQ